MTRSGPRSTADHATQRTTEFGAVTTGLDLLFLDRFERNVREVQAAERVGDVEAVDVVLVFRDGRAAERSQVAERGVATHGARGEQRHRGRVARNRDLRDLFGGQDGGRLDRRNVDRVDRTGADDFDRVELTTGLGGGRNEVDVGGRADADLGRARRTAVARDLVLADRQLRETVGAIGADGDRAREAGGGVGDGDGVAGSRVTRNRASGIGLRVDAANEAKTQSDGQRALLQAFRQVLRSHVYETPKGLV